MTGILQKLAFISMRKNKARTVSTAVGITLAVVLMSAVVTLAASVSSSMVNSAGEKYGSWHVAVEDVSQTQIEGMRADGLISSVCYVKNLGYSLIADPADSAKPYIHVADVSQNFCEYLSCEITEGRMARSANEIVVTSQFVEDYPEAGINSVIEIEVGQRVSSSGGVLWQNASYLGADKEDIVATGQILTCSVVGIIDCADGIEYKFSPGYTLLTCGIDSANGAKAYIKLNNLSKNLSKLTQYISEEKIIYNTQLLSYLGVTDGENMQTLLTSLVVVLAVIIGAAAFVLINNSLTAGSDERGRQFGVLFSIGMTRAQTVAMFLTEVLAVGLFSIAAGIALGAAFAYLCLNTVGKFIMRSSYLDVTLSFSVNFYYLALVAAAALAILIAAAVINAAGQTRGGAITKLRANDVIKAPKKPRAKNRSLSLSVEWSIVLSGFKRYNKKYRYVIISMALSVVLFISAGLFGQYADNYIKSIMPTADYDIAVTSRNCEIFEALDEQYSALSALDGVTESGWLCGVSAGVVPLDFEMSGDYGAYAESRGLTTIEATYIFISDESYAALAKASGGCEDGVLAYDNMTYYSDGEQYSARLFSGDSAEINLYYMTDAQREQYYNSGAYIANSTLKTVKIYRAEEGAFGIELNSILQSGGLFLIIPTGRLYEFVDETPTTLQTFLRAADHSAMARTIKQLGEQNGWSISVTDVAESYEKEKSTYAAYEVFAVIFTVLIALVAVINAFNSVSSNLIKRRKEFAVLQSIGLPCKSFYKLILYECLLLCGIVVLAALVVSPCVSALLSVSFSAANYTFIFPWKYLLISAACAFIVFAAAAIKPVLTIKRQNIIETIKGNSD